ncbi:hypothetical protein ABER68_24705 [Paenibacillus alvei]
MFKYITAFVLGIILLASTDQLDWAVRVFTGATEVGYVKNSMIGAVLLFFLILLPAAHAWGKHGLWLAFILFSLARSVLLLLYLPKLTKWFTSILSKDGPI